MENDLEICTRADMFLCSEFVKIVLNKDGIFANDKKIINAEFIDEESLKITFCCGQGHMILKDRVVNGCSLTIKEIYEKINLKLS